jgi:hypothetical protein
MTNLVTSPEASMFEKPTAADITTGKEADESGEYNARLPADPMLQTNKGASAIFGIKTNWSMTIMG